ncbi:hypothetical protein Tco_1517614 [Tanacetum coccineum]
MRDTRSAFISLDSSEDEPIIVTDEIEKEETERYEDTHTTSHDVPEDIFVLHPPSPKLAQLQEMEIALPEDLKDIPNKLEIFTSTVPSLTSQVDVLKTLQWELLAEFLGFREEETKSDSEDDYANLADSMVETSKQKKLKKFSFVTEGREQIHLCAEKIEEQKRIEESLKDELSKQEVEKVKNKLVDLIGIDVVTLYYNKKLMYDKYCDKMLKRRKSSKITNCDVLIKKGPITMKIYKEDGTNEVISNFKGIFLIALVILYISVYFKAYQPSIPTNPSPKKVVERETEETTNKEQTNFQGSTAHIQPSVNPISIPEPDVPKTLPKPNSSYPSRFNDQKFREKASNQMEKIFQIFQDLRFDISFVDALLLMPRFAPTIKNLLMNKDKLFELAKIPLNKNCSAMLLKKLPEKLRDPGKFLIPCDFSGMDVCHALTDLDTSINLIVEY